VRDSTDSLHPVTKAEIPRAGAVLADAFRQDPVWTKLFGAAQANDPKMGSWYEAPVSYCHRYGKVYASSSRLEAVAGLTPGDLAVMTAWRTLRCGAFLSGLRLGPAMARKALKMDAVFKPIERDRDAHMQGRAFTYLMILGVASHLQGHGHGGSLVRALSREADRAGLPIYLETETERNVRFYERLGFRTLKQITLPLIDLPMWEMLREPGG
jgi:ribosomal protein S18 acetylase RimI-like enzyme